jgi:pimeloyl-ACP methyl ester carboxylesterase
MNRPLTDLTFEPSFRGGSGPPLVLIHGGTATWHVWKTGLPTLIGNHDVLAPTLPGHHGGPPFDRPVDIGVFADGVEQAMDRAGFERAHLAGNSLGGWTALELARRGRARSVVALSPAGGWPPGDRRVRRIFLDTDRRLRASRALLPLLMRFAAVRRLGFRLVAEHGERLTTAEALTVIEGALRADLQGGQSIFDHVCEEIADPGVPVLLAWGERDRLFPSPRYTDAWRRAVPYGEWRTLPGVGHLPMIDDPELVAVTIRDWAAQADRTAAP